MMMRPLNVLLGYLHYVILSIQNPIELVLAFKPFASLQLSTAFSGGIIRTKCMPLENVVGSNRMAQVRIL